MLNFFRRQKPETPTYSELYREFHTETSIQQQIRKINSHSIELKPCPFCGGHANEISVIENGNDQKFVSYIECEQCGCRTKDVEITLLNDPFPKLKKLWDSRIQETQPISAEAEQWVKSISTNSHSNCVYCSMPKDHMATCAQYGPCRRLADALEQEQS